MPATLEQSHNITLTIIDTAGKFIDSKNFVVKYHMLSMPDSNDVLNQSFNQNAAFLKINYFMTNVVDGSLVFRLSDMPLAERFLAEYDNNFMVLPELDDVTLLESLYQKFSVLAGDLTFITDMSLTDDQLNLTYHLGFDPDNGIVTTLPTVDEWLGDLSFWNVPWWERYDVLTFDNVAQDLEERDRHRADTESREVLTVPLDNIDEQITNMLANIKQQAEGAPEHKEGEIISLDSIKKKKQKWTPTIV